MDGLKKTNENIKESRIGRFINDVFDVWFSHFNKELCNLALDNKLVVPNCVFSLTSYIPG